MDVLVEKATELGARGVVVARTARSQKGSGRDARWRRIARAALLQSLGATLPQIVSADTLLSGVQMTSAHTVVLADASGDVDLMEIGSREGPTAVVVGPEGGLTDAERADLVGGGARLLRLGSRRLRSETAAVVALGLVVHALERYSRRITEPARSERGTLDVLRPAR
jgi:16S rRNA (uracil1498-N3)-methyltransferase